MGEFKCSPLRREISMHSYLEQPASKTTFDKSLFFLAVNIFALVTGTTLDSDEELEHTT
jgi:hypothetical protein